MSLPPFEQVVATYGSAVLRVCRARAGAHEAEDAWSETFLAALRAYPRLRPDSDLRAWLLTIAHRKSIDSARASGRAHPGGTAAPEACQADNGPPGPEPELWEAVRRLPPRQRDAVAYHYLADLPYAQVAALVGTTEAAARRAAADGIASLRSGLGREVLA